MATETSITRQAPYIEALGEQYGKDLTALTAKKCQRQPMRQRLQVKIKHN